ncbi:hypothetical protein [Azospirillum sp. TSA6c]|uniref:hypothetical protein n=1 Tax=unclassified Azospirillum TaxID=2630922 RepID=UPI000D647FAE|nr:hypothetical protein [Azospirillum sp. TSA6c]
MASATDGVETTLEPELADFLRPRLRLFLSADLVGSTSFKQSGSLPVREPAPDATLATLGAQWFDPIAQFYAQIERLFSEEWRAYVEEVAPQCRWPSPVSSPELWKANGDELIYVLEVRQVREAYAAVLAWMRTLRGYRESLHLSFPSLDVKAAAWTAGFPLGNVEVVFRRNVGGQDDPEARYGFDQARLVHYLRLERWYEAEKESGHGGATGLVKDYIGPSMDLGFRIAARATPRKFSVTADLALMLAHADPPTPYFTDKLSRPFFDPIHLRYEGGAELKGVLGGKPYPFFWIDMLHDDDFLRAEDRLLGQEPCPAEKVKAFCNPFFERHARHLMRPFMTGCDVAELGDPPANYLAHLRRIDGLWRDEKARYDREEQGLEGRGPDVGGTAVVSVDDEAAASFAQALPGPGGAVPGAGGGAAGET